MEIMVALVLVLIILSVVYGAYLAASRSVDRCLDKTTTSMQARSLLDKMARQLRCTYVPPDLLVQNKTGNITPDLSPETPLFFAGSRNPKDGIILQYITTAALFHDQKFPHGPFEVAYRFDPYSGRLWYHQQNHFPIPTGQNNPGLKFNTDDKNWFPLTGSLTHIELSFFDGQKWHNHWLGREKNSLPRAVKISLTIEQKNTAPKLYTTTIHLPCTHKIRHSNKTQYSHFDRSPGLPGRSGEIYLNKSAKRFLNLNLET
jgi:hypothetical protein